MIICQCVDSEIISSETIESLSGRMAGMVQQGWEPQGEAREARFSNFYYILMVKKVYKQSTPTQKPKIFPADSDAMVLSRYMHQLIKTQNPECREPNFNSWAKDMDAILRLDKRPVTGIKAVMVWAQQDSFWCANILCPGKLREKYDQLVSMMKTRPGLPSENKWETARKEKAPPPATRPVIDIDT